MEQFEEVDPHTGGKAKYTDKLGYESFGPFEFVGEHRTQAVTKTIGSTPILWLETPHFRIGSTLGTYRLVGDRDENERVDDELKRLRKRGARLKSKRGKLDPWLLLHLYAQRAEEAYEAFHADFGIDPEDYVDDGPHLGRDEKFRLLLCQRTSEFSRFVGTYHGVQATGFFRWYPAVGDAGVAVDFGAILENDPENPDEPTPNDSILHATVVSGLAQTFLDGYRSNGGITPIWLRHGYGHYSVRRIDRRWVRGFGMKDGRTLEPDHYEWSGRVEDLVRNDFFTPLADAFDWTQYSQMDLRDHLTTWSRVEYLINAVKGEHAKFLDALFETEISARGAEPPSTDECRAAFEAAFDTPLDDFDDDWKRWVRKTYAKR